MAIGHKRFPALNSKEVRLWSGLIFGRNFWSTLDCNVNKQNLWYRYVIFRQSYAIQVTIHSYITCMILVTFFLGSQHTNLLRM